MCTLMGARQQRSWSPGAMETAPFKKLRDLVTLVCSVLPSWQHDDALLGMPADHSTNGTYGYHIPLSP